jgi:hypothetical protein
MTTQREVSKVKKILTVFGMLLTAYSLSTCKVFSSDIETVTTASTTAAASTITVYGTIREFAPDCWMVEGYNYYNSQYEYYELSGGSPDLYVYGLRAYVTGQVGTTNCTGVMPLLEVESYYIPVCPCDPGTNDGCLSGRVTNRKGKPLVGKIVRLKRIYPEYPGGSVKTRTDDNGCYYFRFLDGIYEVKARRCRGKGGRKKIVGVPLRWKVSDVDFECGRRRRR